MLLFCVTSAYLLLGLVGLIKAYKAKRFDTHFRAVIIVMTSVIGLMVIAPFILIYLIKIYF